MKARFRDASGALVPLALKEPPRLRLAAAGAPGTRARVLSEALARSLLFLGYSPVLVEEGPAELALPIGSPERRADTPELRLSCLRARYASPWEPDEGELSRARGELARLREAARLSEPHAGQMPSERALAGYRAKFAGALADDFDAPRALDTLWAALRPGALSPGTRRAALALADEALGLL